MIHKRIIGGLWLVIGSLIGAAVLLGIGSADILVLLVGTVISLVYFAAGVALLANLQRASRLYLACAVLSLLTFPIGTVIGAYYFWYFFTLERPGRTRQG